MGRHSSWPAWGGASGASRWPREDPRQARTGKPDRCAKAVRCYGDHPLPQPSRKLPDFFHRSRYCAMSSRDEREARPLEAVAEYSLPMAGNLPARRRPSLLVPRPRTQPDRLPSLPLAFAHPPGSSGLLSPCEGHPGWVSLGAPAGAQRRCRTAGPFRTSPPPTPLRQQACVYCRGVLASVRPACSHSASPWTVDGAQ